MHGGGMHSGAWNDNRSLRAGQGGNSYSSGGFFAERPPSQQGIFTERPPSQQGIFAERPPSQQDVSSARPHLVLLKEKLRQRKTARTPTAAGREAFKRDYSPSPNTAPGVGNGRFEYVAASEDTHVGSRKSMGNPPDFGGYDGRVSTRAEPVGLNGRGREVPSPRGGGMTWDAPAIPNEEKESPLSIGARAPAVTARRLSEEMNAYSDPSQFRTPASMPLGGMSAPAFGGLGSSMTSMTGGGDMGHVRSSPSSALPDAYAQGAANLVQCPDCGRSFNAESIDRHMKICKKVFQTKRKQFSSAENRLGDLDNAQQLIANAKRLERSREAAPEKKDKPGKSSKEVKAWEKRSLEFRAAILAAKAQTGDAQAIAKSEEIQQKLQEVGGDGLDPSMIKCQYCGRTFNKEAGERHMKICVKTFGSKPGGGRLIKGGGSRMYKDSAASNGPPPPAPVVRQPVRISSGSSGPSGYPGGGGASYAPPTAQARVSSASRNRGTGSRQPTSSSSSRIAPGSMHR
mmetsp:Transcript_39644/g.61791  ORF Transcript_39644/g.61791 Transcript_39644/m.61791 type:complete len:514 (-) Transcript_39644:26-1567(-)